MLLSRFSIVPELSSAARMPLPGATMARAISLRLLMEDLLLGRGGRRGRAGVGAAARRAGAGVSLLLRCLFGRLGSARGPRAAVRAVEARPLQHDADGLQDLHHLAATGGARGDGVVAHPLDDLEVLVTARAAVVVRRHGPSMVTP